MDGMEQRALLARCRRTEKVVIPLLITGIFAAVFLFAAYSYHQTVADHLKKLHVKEQQRSRFAEFVRRQQLSRDRMQFCFKPVDDQMQVSPLPQFLSHTILKLTGELMPPQLAELVVGSLFRRDAVNEYVARRRHVQDKESCPTSLDSPAGCLSCLAVSLLMSLGMGMISF